MRGNVGLALLEVQRRLTDLEASHLADSPYSKLSDSNLQVNEMVSQYHHQAPYQSELDDLGVSQSEIPYRYQDRHS